MADLIQQVKRYIDEHQLILPDSVVIIGVSGGADSMALLHVLHRLQPEIGIELAVAHLEHGLRGMASRADQEFVATWCQRLNVTFHCRSVDVEAYAAFAKTGIEDAGRRVRQSFFTDLMQTYAERQPHRPIRIALAHHREDQAETLLLHLGRGCGLSGLAGMKPENGPYIRPLLEQPRQALHDYLTVHAIPWRHDATNDELSVLRNRLRHQVLPAWQQALGHDPKRMLARTASLVAADLQLIEAVTREHLQQICHEDKLNLSKLKALMLPLQRQVLRRYWQLCTQDEKDLSLVHLENMTDWLKTARPNSYLTLPHGWRLTCDSQWIFLTRPTFPCERSQPKFAVAPVTLCLPGRTLALAYGLQIDALLIENAEQMVYNNAMECFQLERIQGSQLRYRRPGDRIHPWPRHGGKPLNKLLNELKVPRQLRDRLPLLAVGSEIIWIPGYASNGKYIARPNAASAGAIVCLQVQRVDAKRALDPNGNLPEDG